MKDIGRAKAHSFESNANFLLNSHVRNGQFREPRGNQVLIFLAMCKNPRHAMLANGEGEREGGQLIRLGCWLGRVLRTPDRSLHSDSCIKTAAGIPERVAHARELKDGGVGDRGSPLTAKENVYCLQNEMKNG